MTIEWIIEYEAGELDEEEIIMGFQRGINSGIVWKLQGHYGRTAASLIKSGHCTE